jgi:hypothetical protein
VNRDGRAGATAAGGCTGHVKVIERKRNREAIRNEGSRKRVLKEEKGSIAEKTESAGAICIE